MRTLIAEPLPVRLRIHAEHKTTKRGIKYDKQRAERRGSVDETQLTGHL